MSPSLKQKLLDYISNQDVHHRKVSFKQELIAFCKEHLASYKCPRSVDFEKELPRLDTGKLYKRLLRDRYWEGKTTRIGMG